MMPNTSVSPAASKNSSRPNCNPFRNCSTTSSMDAFGRFRVGSDHTRRLTGLVVREARQSRAPHHEGLKPHPEERALARVSKDEATDQGHRAARHVPKGKQRQRASATAGLGKTLDHFIGHLSWKRSWLSLTMVATVFSESAPSVSFTTSCR